MRHGFIRPPLHFSPVPFAPYYSHLTARRSARACLHCVRLRAHAGLCTLRDRVFRTGAHALLRLSEGASRQGKRERERHLHTMRPLHLMQVPFAPYCLSHRWGRRRKKQVIWLSPGEAADPFFPPFRCVCSLHTLRGSAAAGSAGLPPKKREREREKQNQTKKNNDKISTFSV